MKSPDRDAADELVTLLKDLDAKATPAPWHGDPYDCYIWGNAQTGEMVADRPSHVEPNAQLRMRGVGAKLPIADNMRLIIALRNAVPQIIAQASELAALRILVAEMDEIVKAARACKLSMDDGEPPTAAQYHALRDAFAAPLPPGRNEG